MTAMTNAKINDQKKADADQKKAESEKRADQKKKEKKIKDLQGQGCYLTRIFCAIVYLQFDIKFREWKVSLMRRQDIPASRPNGTRQSG